MYNDRIMDEKQYLSKKKFSELSDELEQLKTEKRKEVAEKLQFAKSLGDLSENAEYQEARDEQAKTEDRILNLEAILKSAEIVSHKKGDKVSVGSQVVVCKKGGQKEQIFYIVDSEEVDMSAGKISYKSPLGKSMLDKTKGDNVVCDTPNGEVRYTIIDVK
jgi:transcription elongation factor GreA